MSKTLEETKQFIIDFSKECHLHEKTIKQLLEDIKTDENGLVSDKEFNDIECTICLLDVSRKQTIKRIEAHRAAKSRKEDAN